MKYTVKGKKGCTVKKGRRRAGGRELRRIIEDPETQGKHQTKKRRKYKARNAAQKAQREVVLNKIKKKRKQKKQKKHQSGWS